VVAEESFLLLAALVDHYRACACADSIIDRAKHPDAVMFHELALPLVGGEEISVGSTETALITPLVSAHPGELDKSYITGCWRKNTIHERALAAWPGIQVWAAGYRSGETNGDSHLDTPPADPGEAGAGEPSERPLAKGVTKTRRSIADLPL
jgi:hypothetical protein